VAIDNRQPRPTVADWVDSSAEMQSDEPLETDAAWQ
jgi:hypothetical protein